MNQAFSPFGVAWISQHALVGMTATRPIRSALGSSSMTPPFPTPQLLIVEDDRALRAILQQVLFEQGYAATAAASLEEALRLVHRQPFDLILTELFTPSDQETVATLLPLRGLAHAIPIVVVTTGLTASEVRQQGFSGLLSKPFGWDDLITTVAEGLN